MFTDPEHIDTTRDYPTTKIVDLGDNELRISKHPRSGLWSISLKHGKIARFLEGQFTSFSEANKKVDLYLRQRSKVVEEISRKGQLAKEKREQKSKPNTEENLNGETTVQHG